MSGMLSRRFSPIELAMVMLVVAIVVYALASRLLRVFEIAEKTALTVTVLEVERGMRIRLALSAMGGPPASVEELRSVNPFEFAHAIPPNYLGELGKSDDIRELKRGNWFYDRERREIGYLPRLASRLQTPDGKEISVLRFRVEKGGGSNRLPHLASAFDYRWEPEFGAF